MVRLILILWAAALTGCAGTTEAPSSWQYVKGREGETPIYRLRVDSSWKQLPVTGVITDTTLPIAEWEIDGIKIVLHNFPADTMEEQDPPTAQVTRWKGQLKADRDKVAPCSYSGYQGLTLEAYGERAVIGFALQLGPDQFQSLPHPHQRQKRGDVTIKATGPIDAIQKHRNALYRFARSFELIEEIPLS